MSYFKQISYLPKYSNVYTDLDSILIESGQNYHGNQISVTSIPGFTHNPTLGCGSLTHNWDNKYTDSNGKIVVPDFDNPMRESDFTKICDIFKGSVFEEMYNNVNQYWHLGRVRIMKLKPKTCLSWHVDFNDRLHYPIKTQEGCLMVINDEVKHLSEHEWWYTHTKLLHTAFNGSKEDRYHVVFTILDNKC